MMAKCFKPAVASKTLNLQRKPAQLPQKRNVALLQKQHARRHFDCHVTVALQGTQLSLIKKYGQCCVPSILLSWCARICQQTDRPVVRGVSGARKTRLSMIERVHQVDGWQECARLCAHPPESNSVQTPQQTVTAGGETKQRQRAEGNGGWRQQADRDGRRRWWAETAGGWRRQRADGDGRQTWPVAMGGGDRVPPLGRVGRDL